MSKNNKPKRSIGFYLSLVLFAISIGLTLKTYMPQWINQFQVKMMQKDMEESMMTEDFDTSDEEPEIETEIPTSDVEGTYESSEDSLELANPPEEEKEINPKFKEAMEKYSNDEIVGYLNIPDTTINYLVVQHEDNEFYLDKDIEKNPNVAGWIYMDYENDIKKEDKNTIIYGHNMKADYMFHSLRYYRDKEYYDAHKTITFNTLYDEYEYEIFSFYQTDIDFYYIQVHFQDDDEFGDLISEMQMRSTYDTGVEVSKHDQILTLSTCVGGDDNRYVVNAKLVKKNGKPVVNTGLEIINVDEQLMDLYEFRRLNPLTDTVPIN